MAEPPGRCEKSSPCYSVGLDNHSLPQVGLFCNYDFPAQQPPKNAAALLYQRVAAFSRHIQSAEVKANVSREIGSRPFGPPARGGGRAGSPPARAPQREAAPPCLWLPLLRGPSGPRLALSRHCRTTPQWVSAQPQAVLVGVPPPCVLGAYHGHHLGHCAPDTGRHRPCRP